MCPESKTDFKPSLQHCLTLLAFFFFFFLNKTLLVIRSKTAKFVCLRYSRKFLHRWLIWTFDSTNIRCRKHLTWVFFCFDDFTELTNLKWLLWLCMLSYNCTLKWLDVILLCFFALNVKPMDFRWRDVSVDMILTNNTKCCLKGLVWTLFVPKNTAKLFWSLFKP